MGGEQMTIHDAAKKILALALAAAMLLGAALAESAPGGLGTQKTFLKQLGDLKLPEDSGQFSKMLAMRALVYNSGQNQADCAGILGLDGFEIVSQTHYDKAEDDISHTCAFTIARREIELRGETRNLVAVVIRGTSGAEWYSNFDFAPSRSNDTVFAENFLYCAEDVYETLKPVLEETERPVALITGYSRGAACANLLGVLLDGSMDEADVYVYTAATPTTVRGNMAEKEYVNIFNLIYPGDVVPRLPLYSMGYQRAGTDIVLPGDEDMAQKIDEGIAALSVLAPDIEAYYTVRHSLTGPGESEDGVTVFEMMQLALASTFSGRGGMSAGNMGAGFSAAGGQMSPESDFAAFMALLTDREGQAGLAKALGNHMPMVYWTALMKMNTQP